VSVGSSPWEGHLSLFGGGKGKSNRRYIKGRGVRNRAGIV